MSADNVNVQLDSFSGSEASGVGLRSALSPDNIKSFLSASRTDDRISLAGGSSDRANSTGAASILDFSVAGDLFSRESRADSAVTSPGFERDIARQKLLGSADKFINNPAQRAQFKQDIAAFEKRAASDGIDSSEIARTFENINRLFTLPQSGAVPPRRGAQLAREVMRHAAKPPTIDQGASQTCNVTTVENLIYSKQPGIAAKLVAEVATTSGYTSSDGTRVTIDRRSLQPDPEARLTQRSAGERTYATQLFNLTAVNLHYQKNKPHIRYEIHPSTKHTRGGERLMDHSKSPPERMRNCRGHLDQPYLDDNEIVGVYEMISGRSGKDVYLGHKEYTDPETGKLLTTFESAQELHDKLAELKRDGKLPIILSVNTAVEPFYSDSGGGSPKRYEGEHVIVVRDFQVGPPARIAVDNSMGEKGDYLGKRMLSLENVYLASMPTPRAVAHLEKQIQEERKRGVRDARKAAELQRLKRFTPAKTCPEEE